MAGAGGVEAFLRLGVHVGTDYLAYEDYMVADGDLRIEGAFEAGTCFVKKYQAVE